MGIVKCKLCGEDIVWVKLDSGESVACDPKPVCSSHIDGMLVLKPHDCYATQNKVIEISQAMKPSEAIENIEYARRWMGCESDFSEEALDMAIFALKKLERSNAQNVNSTQRSRPNALESLNILEQVKDDKGCVPISLVRQAFRNILEQDRWIPVTERLPEKDCQCRVTEGDFKSVIDCHWSNHKKQFEVWSDYYDGYVTITNVTAWKPKEEPYTGEEA